MHITQWDAGTCALRASSGKNNTVSICTGAIASIYFYLMGDSLLCSDLCHIFRNLTAQTRVMSYHWSITQLATLMDLKLRCEREADIYRDTVGDWLQSVCAGRSAHTTNFFHNAQQQGNRTVGVHILEHSCCSDHRCTSTAVIQCFTGHIAFQKMFKASNIGNAGSDWEFFLCLLPAYTCVNIKLFQGRVLCRILLFRSNDTAAIPILSVNDDRRCCCNSAVNTAAAGNLQKSSVVNITYHQTDFVHVRFQHNMRFVR